MLKKSGPSVWALLLAAPLLASLAVAEPAAEPSLKALIVTGQNNHAWMTSTPVLQKMLEDTGLFAVDIAQAPAGREGMEDFQPVFSDYDVVVLDYNGRAWPEATNTAFEAYVREGGGVVVYHAADNAFPNWEEYNKIIGLGGWGGRNEKDGPFLYWEDGEIVRDMSPGPGGRHGRQHAFQVVNRVEDHPITQGLPREWMQAQDELYDTMRGPAENLTVLSTAYSAPETGGTGRHEPILVTIAYGEGRVFHTMLGHVGHEGGSNVDLPAVQSVGFIATFQRGAEWAATGEVTQDVPDDFPTADEVSIRPRFNLPALAPK